VKPIIVRSAIALALTVAGASLARKRRAPTKSPVPNLAIHQSR